MAILKTSNEILRFLLELCVLLAFGYWGFHTDKTVALKILLGIGTPLLAAVLWGIWGAPGSTMQLSGWSLLLLELILFGGASLALASAGRPWLAVAFFVIFVINRVLMYVWRQ